MWLLGNENNYGLSWTLVRDRGAAAGRARRSPRPPALLALRRDHRRASRPVTPIVRWPSPTATCSTSTSSPRSAVDSTCSAPTSTAASPPRDLFQVVKDKLGHSGDVHRVRLRRLQREGDARGPGDAGALPAGPVARRSTSSRPARGGWATPSAASSSSGATAGGSTARRAASTSTTPTPRGPTAATRRTSSQGENNMNEEWWGICAKGPPDGRGLFELYPRAAYYALRRAFALDPYAPGTDLDDHPRTLRRHRARGDGAWRPAATVRRSSSKISERVRLTGLRLAVRDVQHRRQPSSARRISGVRRPGYPAFRGFDRMESFYADFEAKPAETVTGDAVAQRPGQRAHNPIDEIFYENRGRSQTVPTQDAGLRAQGHRAREGLPGGRLLGRPLVPAGRLLPHRPLPLGLRGRLLRPLPRGVLRREHRHLRRRGAGRLRDRGQARVGRR